MANAVLPLNEIESFDRWTPFSLAVTFREPKREPLRSILAHHSRGTDAGFNGWDLSLVDGYVESRLYRVWPGNAIGVRTKEPIPLDRWQQLAATYDGSSTAAGLNSISMANARPRNLRDNVRQECERSCRSMAENSPSANAFAPAD